jgi:hypothetical protein
VNNGSMHEGKCVKARRFTVQQIETSDQRNKYERKDKSVSCRGAAMIYNVVVA